MGRDELLKQTASYFKDLDRLSRVKKIEKLDNRNDLAKELEEYRLKEVTNLQLTHQMTRTSPHFTSSSSQKNFFKATGYSQATRGSTNTTGGWSKMSVKEGGMRSTTTAQTGGHGGVAPKKHVKVHVVLGEMFSPKGAKLLIEGEVFGRAEVSETCALELQNVIMKPQLLLPVTLSVLKNEQLIGFKQASLFFSKEPFPILVRAGEQLTDNFTFTIKLFS